VTLRTLAAEKTLHFNYKHPSVSAVFYREKIADGCYVTNEYTVDGTAGGRYSHHCATTVL